MASHALNCWSWISSKESRMEAHQQWRLYGRKEPKRKKNTISGMCEEGAISANYPAIVAPFPFSHTRRNSIDRKFKKKSQSINPWHVSSPELRHLTEKRILAKGRISFVSKMKKKIGFFFLSFFFSGSEYWLFVLVGWDGRRKKPLCKKYERENDKWQFTCSLGFS